MRAPRMEAYGKTYELVMQFSQENELRRFKSDRELAAAKLSGADKQKRQVQRDIDNVQSVIAAAEEFGKLMDDVAARLAAAASRKEAA